MSADADSAARYFLPDGYVERLQPEYFVDDTHQATGVTWQPDVYRLAAAYAARLRARTVVDIGCGDGAKLLADCGGFTTIGIDYGSNLERCRRTVPERAWRELDLEGPDPLPVTRAELRGGVLVCADVIEHLVNPVPLLRRLREALTDASLVLVSTPERVLTWGVDHRGPPPNVCHAREWSLVELGRLLRHERFECGVLGLTRSHDEAPEEHTCLAILPSPQAARALKLTGWAETLGSVPGPRRPGPLSSLLGHSLKGVGRIRAQR